MYRVSMLGLCGFRKSYRKAAYKISDRILKLTYAYNTTIVQSQHDYHFIPTTEEKFLI